MADDNSISPRRVNFWVGVRTELDLQVHRALAGIPPGKNESEFIKKCIAENYEQNKRTSFISQISRDEIEALRGEFQKISAEVAEIKKIGLSTGNKRTLLPCEPEARIEAVNVKERELEEKLNRMGEGW